MNWTVTFEIGFKILAAVVAGAAVFVGVNRAMNRGKNGENKNSNSQPFGENMTSSTFGPSPNMNNPQTTPQQQTAQGEKSRGEKMLDGLKGATGTCAKLLSFVQSLTSVTENFSRIFKDDSYYYLPNNYYGYGCGYGYGYGPPPYGYQELGGQQWRRLNPLVLEDTAVGNYSRNQQYPI